MSESHVGSLEPPSSVGPPMTEISLGEAHFISIADIYSLISLAGKINSNGWLASFNLGDLGCNPRLASCGEEH